MMGLTSGEAQRLAGEGKNNRIRTGSQDSVGRIVLQNVFTYFNAIFCFLSVLLIITGSFKNLTFMGWMEFLQQQAGIAQAHAPCIGFTSLVSRIDSTDGQIL